MTMAQGFQLSPYSQTSYQTISVSPLGRTAVGSIPRGTTTTTSLALPRLRRELPVVKQSSRPLERPGIDNGDVSKEEESMLSLEERKRELAAAEEENSSQANKGATVASSTMSLIKVIVGTGILALPYGVAAVSDYPVAYVFMACLDPFLFHYLLGVDARTCVWVIVSHSRCAAFVN